MLQAIETIEHTVAKLDTSIAALAQRERDIADAALRLARNTWRAIFVTIVLGLAGLATSGCVYDPGYYGGGYHHEHEHGGWR